MRSCQGPLPPYSTNNQSSSPLFETSKLTPALEMRRDFVRGPLELRVLDGFSSSILVRVIFNRQRDQHGYHRSSTHCPSLFSCKVSRRLLYYNTSIIVVKFFDWCCGPGWFTGRRRAGMVYSSSGREERWGVGRIRRQRRAVRRVAGPSWKSSLAPFSFSGPTKPPARRRLPSGFQTKNRRVQRLGRTRGIEIFA